MLVLCVLKHVLCVIWRLWIYNFVSDAEEEEVIEITWKNSKCIEFICLAHIGHIDTATAEFHL